MTRDEKGRFVKGNKASPGRKPRTEEQEIIAALDGAIPLSEVLERLRRAVLKGEDWAIKLYLAYYWHLPTQPVKNDMDGQLRVIVVDDEYDNGEVQTTAPSTEDYAG